MSQANGSGSHVASRPIVQDAIELLDAGFRPVIIYPSGYPLPGKGERIAAGKEPFGKEWGVKVVAKQTLADDARYFTSKGHNPNIGLCLGPGRAPNGGWLIDIEGDGTQAEPSRLALFDGETIDTKGWNSARGFHQLYRADESRMTALAEGLSLFQVKGANQPGVFHIPSLPDLELRVGGWKSEDVVKQLQSVCPPSIGTDRKPRTWFPCNVLAALPEAFYVNLERFIREAKTLSKPIDKPKPKGLVARTSQRKTDYELASEALGHIGRMAEDYQSWVNVGMALHAGLGSEGLALWEEWSAQSAKNRPGECPEKWKSFTTDGGIGLGSLFAWATEAGWGWPWKRNVGGDGWTVTATNSKHSEQVTTQQKTADARMPTTTGGQDIQSEEPSLASAVLHLAGQGAEILLRDKATIELLARIHAACPAEFEAIKIELKAKIKGFPVQSLIKAVKAQELARTAEMVIAREENEYIAEHGCLYWKKLDPSGRIDFVKLCNFVASVVEEISRDDGNEKRTVFVIEGHVEGEWKFGVEVPAEQFEGMEWICSKIGMKAIVEAGRGFKDHIRVAIQKASANVKRTIVYTHTGWIDLDGKAKYLTTSGGIGHEGLDSSIRVDLGKSMEGYKLPAPATGLRRVKAIRSHLNMLLFGSTDRACSRGLAAVLVASPMRAVLGHANYSILFHGPTGTMKTSTASLSNQCYGPGLDFRSLPLAWDSTANSLNHTLYQLDSALGVIDDFVPSGSAADIDHAQKEADRVFRSQGNGQGRLRLNKDGTVQPAKAPRGLIISTGEDRPRNRSANARCLPVSFSRDCPETGEKATVNPEILSHCQAEADAGFYAEALASYVQWLAPRIVAIRLELPERAKALRPLATRPGDHARTPDIVADLAASFDYYMDFAVEAGAVTLAEAKRNKIMVWDGLLELASEARTQNQEDGDPAERYLQLLADAINSAKAYLVDPENGDAPINAEAACGWRRELKWQGNEVGQVPYWVVPPNSTKLGWYDAGTIYLLPNVAYSVAARIAQTSGVSLTSKNELHLQLLKSGKLSRTAAKAEGDVRGRVAVRISLEKKQQSVLAVREAAFWPSENAETAQKDRPRREEVVA